MKLLFGSINGFTAAATLAGPQADAFAKTLASMQDVAGATDEAFAKMAGSVELGGQKIANSLTALLVAIGDPLLAKQAVKSPAFSSGSGSGLRRGGHRPVATRTT